MARSGLFLSDLCYRTGRRFQVGPALGADRCPVGGVVSPPGALTGRLGPAASLQFRCWGSVA